ncbi:DNA/RNA non-specific endonuclease [Dorea sp. YH-dor226]|uniref:DNA/RNA non-specific endonuclease n=1 Tax=Dorea sp. YH-dor226 TaxID=3151119 RepID=UPI0032423405
MMKRKMLNKLLIAFLLSASLFVTGCGEKTTDEVSDTNTESTEEANSVIPEEAEKETQEDIADVGNTEGIADAEDVDSVPEYEGDAYVTLNQNEPEFEQADMTTEAFEEYSELDDLGRCGEAYANICQEIMPTEERGAIGMVKPSGWHTVKYNDLIDGNYLYNRCHLIGYQLAGENANEENLITGTRYLNVEGMLPFENMVADFVEETGYHVLYRVTPVYEGDDLVAVGVQIEALSVEDEGEGICFNVYCYNVQPGITIDYSDGESSRSEHAEEEVRLAEEKKEERRGDQETQASVQEKAVSGETVSEETTYILNTNTKKFHRPDCGSVDTIKEQNKKEVAQSREELIKEGYDPCGRCNP